MTNDIISIIIPAYNAERTISRCISSILNQTYSDIELIVVNDGSSDSTEEIVKRFVHEDKRVKLYTIKNSGVSHARNIGIKQANGAYITFVDSDDYIDTEMYSMLIDLFNKYDIQIAHCSYKNVTEDGIIISVVGNKDKKIFLSHDEGLECLLSGRLFIGGLCNKLYKASLFKNLSLDESISINEDVLMNFQLFDKAQKTIYIDKPFYNYVSVASSSTHSSSSLKKGKQGLYVSRKMLAYSRGESYERIAEKRVALGVLGLYRENILSNQKLDTAENKELIDEIQDYRKKGYLSSKKDKLLYFVCRFFPIIFKYIFFVYDKIRKKKLDPEQ